jgi:hypothetical protein
MLLNWNEVKIREAKIIFMGICVAVQHVRFMVTGFEIIFR